MPAHNSQVGEKTEVPVDSEVSDFAGIAVARAEAATPRIPTVLIVEDEFLIRAVLADFLAEEGFRVREASSADEAVRMLAEAAQDVDLVFTDVRMPGSRDGFGLAKWVRENRPGIPVMVASGGVGTTQNPAPLHDDLAFFTKPYDLDAIVKHMRKVL